MNLHQSTLHESCQSVNASVTDKMSHRDYTHETNKLPGRDASDEVLSHKIYQHTHTDDTSIEFITIC